MEEEKKVEEKVEPTESEKMKIENDRREEILVKETELQEQARLSGRALAGSQPAPEESDDDKWKREAKERYAGTGMDPTE